jgi:hypothetical protein
MHPRRSCNDIGRRIYFIIENEARKFIRRVETSDVSLVANGSEVYDGASFFKANEDR